jgi:hypothetical protein
VVIEKMNWMKLYGILGLVAMLSACAGIQHRVQFTVQLPGKIDLAKLQRIAVMDFSVAFYNHPEQGVWLAQDLADQLRIQAQVEVVPVEVSRRAFREMRIPRSRFTERSTLKKIGKKLNAKAILFGDLSAARIKKYSTYKTVVRQRGVRREAQAVSDHNGTTRTVWKSIPIYVDITQETIRRSVQVQVQARVVKSEDGSVLWEKKLYFDKTVKTIMEDGEIIRGNKEVDGIILRQFIAALSEEVLREILPRIVKRTRELAEALDESEYGQLIRQGNEAVYKRDWQLAGNYWLQAQALQPKRPEAKANLGILREAEMEFEQALLDYTYAAKIIGKPWIKYREQVKKVLSKH